MFGDHIGCVPTSRWSVVANSTVQMVLHPAQHAAAITDKCGNVEARVVGIRQ